jgi:nucleotide-binding universal stress UspA family protein
MASLSKAGKWLPKTIMRSILAFIDFSDVTDAVVENAADLARAFKAKLILVHVTTPEADYEGGEMRTNISREGVAGEMHRYHHRLQKLESDYRDAGIDATSLLVRSTSARGKPVRKILQEIMRVRPDLIVVGSHGHGLVHKVLLGSVSSAVVRKAPCPVVVVPATKRLARRKKRIPN